jgi:hypothetical protein
VKSLVWIVTVVLALIWTVSAAVLASLAGWLAANAGDMASWTGQIAQWPAPEWLAMWVGPELLAWLRSAATSLIGWGSAALPTLGSLLQWLAPLVWVIWALGIVCLLALAGGVHYAIGRVFRPATGDRVNRLPQGANLSHDK